MKTKPTYQELENEVKELRKKLSETKSEDYFKELLKNNTDAFSVIGINGNNIFQSETNFTIMGYTPEERIGKNTFELMPPDDRNKIMQVLKELINKPGVTEKISFRAYHKNGSIKYLEGTAKNMLHSPIINGIIVNFRDVTELKKQEKALKESLNQIEAINANTPNIIWKSDIDKQGNFTNTYISEVADEFLALPKGTINNSWDKYFSYIIPDYLPQINELFKKGIANPGQLFSFSYEVKKADGKKAWFTSSGRIRVENNKLTAYGSTVDITERKLAEEALKESEKNLLQSNKNLLEEQSLFRIGNVVVFKWQNKEGWPVEYVSKNVFNVLGYTPEDFLSAKISYANLIHKDDIETVSNEVNNAIINNLDSFTHKEYRIINKAGEDIWIYDFTTVIRNSGGEITHFYGYVMNVTDRKQAEEQLHNEREKLFVTLRSIGDGVITTDTEGMVTFINSIAEELTGWSRHDATGQPLSEVFNIINEKTGEPVENPVKKVLDSGAIIGLANHTALITVDGTMRSIADSAAPILDAQGKIIGVVLVFRDVTEKKKIEEALKEKERFLQTIFDGIQEPMHVIDRNFKVLLTNKKLLEMKNVKQENIRGKYCYEAYQGRNELCEQCGAKEVFKTGKSFSLIKSLPLPNGTYRYFEVYSFPLLKENGEVDQVIEMTRDITERKQAEEALRKSQQMNQSMLKAIPDLIFVIDKNYVLRAYNSSSEKDLYAPPEVFLGKNVDEVLPHDIAALTKENVDKVLRNGEISVYEYQIEIAGKTRFYDTRMVFQEKNLVLTINRDITERKKAELELLRAKEKAEESDRLKSAFLANMSHEIRTPMNAILGFGSFLKDPELSTEKRNYFVDIINRSGNHLLNLINDIVDISKIDAGQMTVIETECKLNEFLFEIYQFFHSAANTNEKQLKISIKKSLPDGFDVILTDTTRLRQILINLIGNAVKFTNEGGIDIKYLITENNEIEFSVKDSGIGISEKDLPIIFKRFRQADETLTRKYGGTGLGLAISKACVELLGGKIWVESQIGKGSTFSFTIPYKPINKPTKEKETVHANTKNIFAGKTILIVEDEPYSCLILEEILQHTGATVEKATNGKQAIDLCKQKPEIDIVLMDIQLPYIDGLSATKEILKFRPDLPIISQTANAMQHDREKSIKAGCVDYITKPINAIILISTIAKYIH